MGALRGVQQRGNRGGRPGVRSVWVPFLLLLWAPLPLVAVQGSVPSDGAGVVEPPTHASRTAVAVRTEGPISLDGILDEPAWAAAPVIRDFRQIEPVQGAAPLVGTEVRFLFDDAYLYVGFEVLDPEGPSGIRVPEMRRNFEYFDNDLVGVSLDGFGDGRSAVGFLVNPRGALRDLRVFDGRFFDREWQGVWEARTRIHEGGWSAEVRIPWSTLRYDPAAEDWRVMLVRRTRRLNEEAGWPEWPRQNNMYTMRYAASLEGLEPPPPPRNVQLQPYVTLRSEGDPRENAFGGARQAEVGGEVKWAVSPSTVVDLTVNTDFAEADVDRQVVNLTRFSVFFPEQRPFFLENAGLFRVIDQPWIEPFYSRRIGLASDGTPLRLQGGARVTSQSPARSFGGLLLRQEGEAGGSSTFGVGRWQQNLGTGHRVGGLVVSRLDENAEGALRQNHVGAVDGYLRLGDDGWVRGMLSGSLDQTDDARGWSGLLWAAHNPGWGYVGWIQRWISPGYRPRTGFVPRTDLVTTSPAASLDFRPDWLPGPVLALRPAVSLFMHHRASDLRFEEGYVRLRPVVIAFRDGGEFRFQWEPNRQELQGPFSPLPGLVVAPGSYRFARTSVFYRTDPSARLSASVEGSTGGYFDGELQDLSVALQAVPLPHVAFGLRYQGNRITGLGPESGAASTHLVAPELRVSLNARTQLFAFYQHNTAAGTGVLNARFSWEFAPLSFVHLVVNDGRPVESTLFPDRGLDGPRDRQILLKVSYLRGL